MNHATATILVVEDDATIARFLADNLVADGYDVVLAESVRAGWLALERRSPDLAIVDVSLGDGSGLDLVRAVRTAEDTSARVDAGIPVIILSGRASDLDRVRGFERGCDDYVPKPFNYAELLYRMRSLLRRAGERPQRGLLRIGRLNVDPASRDVRIGERRIELSQKEYALLRMLAAEPTRVFTKDELLRDVWGFRSRGATRTLDSHACRLRKKLSTDGERFVVNVWGVGYRLVEGKVAA